MPINPNERVNDETTAIKIAMDAVQAKIRTAMPGIIQSFDAGKMTATIQPAIQGVIAAKDGSAKMVDLPLLLDCPVQFPTGGGVILTLPVAAGDECLVVFGDRCIDAWWQQGGVQPPMEYRMMDLSDGFCIPGVKSQPNVVSGISTTAAQLRSLDGSTVLELDPAAQTVKITAPGGSTIDANVTINGTLKVTGDVEFDGAITATGDLTVSGVVNLGGTGGLFVKRSDNSNATKVKAI